ncbi:ROK family protein [Maribacter sp. HTCC2170]|uniref:ROK family protein n=1 Tax=Maribacter sp. (strain HTCC2170 / KCCM 42371) TaxID=313603 RepID=UPI00006B1B27|nr:ROK family protein [Maribacter sp. HTCC2170]EAR00894.1 ROK family protein [Maribacter sp. HTCC2170]
MAKSKKFIGIDLGGTKVNVGLVEGDKVIETEYAKLPQNQKSESEVIDLIVDLTKSVISRNNIDGIGIGVPSILDRKKGIIYEVQNIPLWNEVPLGNILAKEFDVPIYMNNDANCFALGEYYFGAGQGCEHFVGLTLGTGMGSGIITNGRLLNDANCGSGEFGMIPYKEGVLEDYCSGKFFKRHYNSNGEELLYLAKKGDVKSIEAFEQFGIHLGNAIKIILYAIDPEKIIIGGSILNSASFFKKSLENSIQNFGYKKVLENFEIKYSNTPNIAVLGAASLCLESKN